MALQLLNALLTNNFQATLPSKVQGEKVVLDFLLSVANTATPPATHATIEWYPEFTWLDPNAAGTQWYRESTEENQGAGDVLMAQSIRRFAEYGGVDLPEGTFAFDVQLKRVHAFYRLQIRTTVASADTCQAVIWDPFGTVLQSAP